MAKASVKLTCPVCGEEYYYEKRGFCNRTSAGDFEEWAQETLGGRRECPDCYRKRMEAEKEEAAEKAASFCKERGVCLGGSDKQVRWAYSIIADFAFCASATAKRWEETRRGKLSSGKCSQDEADRLIGIYREAAELVIDAACCASAKAHEYIEARHKMADKSEASERFKAAVSALKTMDHEDAEKEIREGFGFWFKTNEDWE